MRQSPCVDSATSGRERRESPRHLLCVPCTVLESRTNIGIFWSRNIGLGGVLMCGGDFFEPGQRLRIILHFPWSRSVSVAASVVPRDPEAPAEAGIALRFEHEVFSSRDPLQQVLDEREQPRAGNDPVQALIMTTDRELRLELERDVLSADARPVPARRPLDAIWRLTSSATSIRSIFVDSRLMGARSPEWFRFLGKSFPHLTRVLVQTLPMARHPSSMLLMGLIDAFLVAPWSSSYVHEIVTGDRHRVLDAQPAELHASGRPVYAFAALAG
ncbi:MAG: hypothetical protein ABIJ09_08815 [Pseudomonadota bacterium]